jgi:hypothetical protein
MLVSFGRARRKSPPIPKKKRLPPAGNKGVGSREWFPPLAGVARSAGGGQQKSKEVVILLNFRYSLEYLML